MRLSPTLRRIAGDRQLLVGSIAGTAIVLLILVRAYGEAGELGAFLQFTLVGLSTGCVLAVAASGLVLTYTTTGVFNFAHGAVGMVAAFLYYRIHVDGGVPVPIALAIVLLVVAP